MEWKIIETFFADNANYTTKHQLDAYNDFVRNKLPRAIRQIPIKVVRLDERTKEVRHEISVHIGGLEGKDIFLAKPVYLEGKGAEKSVRPLYPNDALVKSMYYASDLIAHVVIRYSSPGKAPKDVVYKDVRVGSIPIMVHSCLCVLHGQNAQTVREMGGCMYDQGGYFITDGGKEKVIIAQERIATNRLFISLPDPERGDVKHSLDAQIQCTTENDPFQKTVIMHINNEEQRRRSAVFVRLSKDIPEDVPIFVAFRALGVESDRRILEHIVGDLDDPSNAPLLDFLYYSVVDNPHNIYTQNQALEYLKEFVRFKDVDHVRHIITNDFLRNAEDTRKKAVFFGMLIAKLVKTHLGILPLQSRDDFMNKRVDTSGVLVYDLFLEFYNNLRRDIRKQIDRAYTMGAWYDKADGVEGMIKPADIGTIIDANIIETGLRSALKGHWPGVELEPEKAGIVQDLNRISYVGYQSHVRRLNTPLSRDLKLAAPRRLHNSQWGVICPYQSPDGASIGLDKHLAALTHVTIDTGVEPIKECLQDLGCIPFDDVGLGTIHRSTKVFINNNLVFLTKAPRELVDTLRLYRRNGLINAFVSVCWRYITDEIQIFTQSGRLTRPLLVVHKAGRVPPILGRVASQLSKKGSSAKSQRKATSTADPVEKDKLVWKKLFSGYNAERELNDENYVSPKALGGVTLEQPRASQAPFVDVEESDNCLVAMWPSDIKKRPENRYTHCEIHPSTTLSLYTNTIPFANHNQAPRIVFSGAQGKQAIGVYATNFNIRMDTMTYVLHYPQRPLVTTRYNRMCHTDALPNGENLIVAIACYTGYNQEDAILVNKSSVERGMFNLTYYKSFLESEKNDPMRGRNTLFCNPHELGDKNVNVKLKRANVLTIDENGMPKPNAHIDEDDLLLGKLTIASVKENGKSVTVLNDASKRADKTVEGIIDRTVVFKDEAGELNAKVRMRKFRVPMLGDKMASRHGQKGVCGMVLAQEDMPFTQSGVVPDIIINPHAIPSRMTISHILECVVAKAAALGGFLGEATVFEEQDIAAFGKALEKQGYERYGNEIMYCGFNGEQIETDIFIRPTFYFRLKHQAADKINYRATGQVSTVTRQPVRGRAVDGGLRIGEMERDAVLANGMSGFLKEAFIDRSDAFQFNVDAMYRGNNVQSKNVVMPYSAKIMLQEVYSLGIDARLLTTMDEAVDMTALPPDDDEVIDAIFTE